MNKFLVSLFNLLALVKAVAVGQGEVPAVPAAAAAVKPSCPNAACEVTYYGGPLIQQVNITALYVGEVASQPVWDQFYQGVTQSSCWDGMAREYSIGDSYQLQRGSFKGSIQVPLPKSTLKKKIITELQIRSLLKILIAKGTISSPDENSFYPVHLPPESHLLSLVSMEEVTLPLVALTSVAAMVRLRIPTPPMTLFIQ